MQSDNGFEDMEKILKGIDIGENVADEALSLGADAFATWLRPTIPLGYGGGNSARYGHMRDQLQVVKTKEGYDVTFGDAFWWIFVENGTGGKSPQRARNFVRGTFTQHWNELENIIQNEALKKLEK